MRKRTLQYTFFGKRHPRKKKKVIKKIVLNSFERTNKGLIKKVILKFTTETIGYSCRLV